MRHRVAWLSTAPLMLAGLLAGHAVGYRLAFSDPHARADALGHSGHSYFAYLPFALAISASVLLAGLVLHAISAFRGEPRRPAASPVIVLLPPVAFVAQEVTERLVHTGQIPWTVFVQPAFLIGLALQLPFALAALLLAWALDFAARAVGRALASRPRLTVEVEVPIPVLVTAGPRVAGLARGYAERAPPLLRRP
jgi:hypothetical protein